MCYISDHCSSDCMTIENLKNIFGYAREPKHDASTILPQLDGLWRSADPDVSNPMLDALDASWSKKPPTAEERALAGQFVTEHMNSDPNRRVRLFQILYRD